MPKTSCLVVSPFELIGDLFESMLTAHGHDVIGRASDPRSAQQSALESPTKIDIVILLLCTQTTCQPGLIGWLGEEYPGTRVLIVTTRADPDFLATCVSAGADGYLYADMKAAGFLASLDLLMAGEKVLPSKLATEIRHGEIVVAASDEASAQPIPSANLTELESDILALVAQGDSNKTIAAACELTEASVKMYLRQIFAKLNVQNRAQAAAWHAATTGGSQASKPGEIVMR